MSAFIAPVDLPVSSGYGMRDGGFHYGIDFSDGVAGHPIRAVAAGEVIYNAYEDGGFGNTITLLHGDNLKSGYGHMVEPSPLPVGTRVNQGDVIGHVGSTGASTGPHLHLWMGSSPNPPGVIDPTPLLGGATPGDEEMTQEQMDTIGQWLKDTEARIEKQLGEWMQEQASNVVKLVNAHIDQKLG